MSKRSKAAAKEDALPRRLAALAKAAAKADGHAALPATTCRGDDCTGRGPKHRVHPKFPCACGMWYGSERGRRIHLSRVKSDAAEWAKALENLWGTKIWCVAEKLSDHRIEAIEGMLSDWSVSGAQAP